MNPVLIFLAPVTAFAVTALITIGGIMIFSGLLKRSSADTKWRHWQVNYVFKYTDGTESAEKNVRFAARSYEEASFIFSSVVVIHGKIWEDLKFPQITSIAELPWPSEHIGCVRTSK